MWLKVRMPKARIVVPLLYRCGTWIPSRDHYDQPRKVHHSLFFRSLGWQKRKSNIPHPISYAFTLFRTGSESIEVMVNRQRMLFAAFVARMGEEFLT